MDDTLAILIGFAVLGVVVILLVAGGIAFVLGLRLRKRVRTLEARLSDLEGAPSDSRAPAPDVVEPSPQPPVSKPDRERPRVRRRPAPTPTATPTAERASSRASWERLESRLGTQWLNWIGALVTLLAVAFLLKFLYDQGLIGPAGRVAIGLGAGLGFLGFAELRMRRRHDLLAQAISSVGVGTLFLTTYLSYKFYGFGGQLATFALMTWFAAFAVTLAVLRRGKVLAILGIVCAYACPLLVSTGLDQAEALFAYLALLGLAAGAVRLTRNWLEITPLALTLTAVYYAGWYARFGAPDRLAIAVTGATGIAVLFPLTAFARALARRRAPGLCDVVTAALAEVFAVYYLWIALASEHRVALGFVLTALALCNLALFWALYARRALDDVVEAVLLVLASGFLLLVIPASLRAEGALVAWSLAAVVLADAARRSGRGVLLVASCAALVIAVVVGLGQEVRHSGIFHFAVNGVFMAWLAVAVAWLLAGQRTAATFTPRTFRWIVAKCLQVVGSAILLGLLSYEVTAWFRGETRVPGADRAWLGDAKTAVLLALWALYPALYLWRAKRSSSLWVLAASHFVVLGLGFLVLVADLHRRDVLLFLNVPFAAGLLFPAAVFVVARGIGAKLRAARIPLELYGHVLVVVLLSFEIYGVLGLREWSERREWISTALVSVAWAVYAFTVLGLGMRYDKSAWRWFALALLGVTLVKVLVVDMSRVRQIWRVISFAVLGALLMVCSYGYARRDRRKKAELHSDDTRSS